MFSCNFDEIVVLNVLEALKNTKPEMTLHNTIIGNGSYAWVFYSVKSPIKS